MRLALRTQHGSRPNRKKRLQPRLERSDLLGIDGLSALDHANRKGIDSLTATIDLVVEVSASGQTGRSDIADDLPAPDHHPRRDGYPAHMPIAGGNAAAMVKAYVIAVASVPAGVLHAAIRRCVDWRTP